MTHRISLLSSAARRLLPAACFVLAILAGRADAQTIANPGFEQDLTDWSTAYERDMSAASSEAAHSGKFGLRVTDSDPKRMSRLESLAIEATPGQKYQVTFWARTVSGDGGVAVSLRFFDEKTKSLSKKPPSISVQKSPEWKQYTVTGLAPAAAVAFSIVIHSIGTENVTADLDDFECKPLP